MKKVEGNNELVHVGKRLKELRKKSNKTQEEVSAALEMRRAKYLN